MVAPSPRYPSSHSGAWSLWDAGHSMHFSRGRVIFDEDDAPDRLYLIVEGKVRIGRESAGGRRCLFSLLGPSEVFGEDGLLGGGLRSARATAMTPVRVIALSRSEVDAQLVSDPAVVDFLLGVVARRLRRTSDDITDLMSATVSARVAKCLLRLAQKFGQQENGAIRVSLDLTQEQLAQLVGTSRESMNKVLSDFVDRGWIRLDGAAVIVVAWQPLAQRMAGARRLNLPAVVHRNP